MVANAPRVGNHGELPGRGTAAFGDAVRCAESLLLLRANVTPARLKYHSGRLDDLGFVHIMHWSGGTDMSLLGDGAGWLDKHGLMPPG